MIFKRKDAIWKYEKIKSKNLFFKRKFKILIKWDEKKSNSKQFWNRMIESVNQR
jgi:hypothetical protein